VNKLNVVELCAEYHNTRDGNMEKIMCVWFPFNYSKASSSTGKQDIQEYCSGYDKSHHCIFITDAISFQAVEYLNQSPFYWEVLSYDDTACAKNNHCYVPQYKLLTESEIKDVEKRYGSRQGFNKMIAKVDAMARFMDFREGDVILIDTFSCIGGTMKSYRFVISQDGVM